MNRKILFKEIKFLIREYEDLDDRLRKEENKVLADSVSASSTEYPYTSHSVKIESIQDSEKLRKYKKMIKAKKRKIGEKILDFEYQMNNVEKSEIRMLLRYKYIDGLTNYQIAHKMNDKNLGDYTEESVRMKINRFFEKN